NEAALQAARTDKNKIEMIDFEKAKDKILMGSERKSMIVSEEDRKITAYHEAGHTIVGRLLPGMDPIHKVSIIPRGMAMGVTQTLPLEDVMSLTKSKAQNMIAFLFGGRAAEEIIFKNVTTGAGNDIERATALARSMVCEWGMSEKLGPIALEKREGPVYLGMSMSSHREYSEAKAEEIDSEIKKIVFEGHQKALDILNSKMDVLHNMAQALLEHETIDTVEVEMIINGQPLIEIEKLRTENNSKLLEEQKRAAKADEDEKKKTAKGSGSRDPMGNPGPITA
ncbi:MAG: cell division protein FtsH, partial [Bdellovibrionales bacterium]